MTEGLLTERFEKMGMADQAAVLLDRADSLSLALKSGADPRELIAELTTKFGAVHDTRREPARLSCLGITTSCTCGPHGLLTNWIARVHRIVGKVGA